MNNNQQLDLVDEMDWENNDKVEILSLKDAGLEEDSLDEGMHVHGKVFRSGIHSYLDWFYDGNIESGDY